MATSPNRRSILQALAAVPGIFLASACSSNKQSSRTGELAVTPLNAPHAGWREKVSADAFNVLFNEATEPPNSSALNAEERAGVYVCAACFLPLFTSENKFDSGTGWPSFTQPISGHLVTKSDFKLVLPRTEYHCGRCEGHQGHVFDDGPQPRGERWCNNGVALKFVLESQQLPELRS